MKKLGFIIMLALVLTVGGVYATFNYAQGEIVEQSKTLTTIIADKKIDFAKGTVTVDTDFAIRVDDYDDDLTTTYRTSGTTSITFTPAEKGADEEVVNSGVELKLVITINGTNTYGGTPIFKTKNYPATGGVSLGKGTKNTLTGAFEYSVDLANYLEVSKISLPTADDYDAFFAAFNATSISITVSE